MNEETGPIRSAGQQGPASAKRPSAVPASLSSTRRRAYGAILIERAYPLLLGLGLVAAVYLILSWFGLFAAAPALLRFALLGLVAAAVLFVVWRSRGLRLPSAEAVDRRIEAKSRLDHQPLATQIERPTSDDPFALALWREHQARMAARLRDLSAGTPRTEPERFDPFALRAVVALVLVTAFAFSYGSRGGQIDDAFAATPGPILPGARVDAWVTPPTYTGQPPVFLTGTKAEGAEEAASLRVPAGSVLSIRVSDGANAALTFTPDGGEPATIAPGPLPEAANDAKPPVPVATPANAAPDGAENPAPGAGSYEVKLAQSGSAELSGAFTRLGGWRFDVVPDTAPSIAFAAEPATARNGAMELAYTVNDDYGVRRGEVELVVKEEAAPGARPLVAAPEIALAMPRRAKGEGKGRTSANITESPYAGAKVAMTLVAHDDAGQTGVSEPKLLTLPARRFSNPLARAVIEQRRILALDANAAKRVVGMIDAVTVSHPEFIARSSDYLALRAARTRIATAANDDTLREAVDFLWQIALGIEDGNLSAAEKNLRDAREKLSEALENGASQEEIDKLMAELREAMQAYMQAMAEAMKDRPPLSQNQMSNAQEIRPQDLDKMLDRIEDLAKSGSKDAAQQLLSELQSMMDNMQAMQQQPGQQGQSGEENAMQQQMDKLGELLRRQQELKDKTFDLGRKQVEEQQRRPRQPGEEGQPGQPGDKGEPMTAEQLKEALKSLKDQQAQLQKELGEMQDGMKGMGIEPGEGFGEAGKAMGRAEGALGEGDDGGAVGEQGKAMEALRRGAKDMMSQMQQAMQQGQGQQPGQGQMGEGYGRGQQRSGRDPLGRQRATQGPDFGQDVDVPDEIDTQRARRILDSIRSRLGNQLSPQQEREYLERLLRTP
ncbi:MULTISPECIES: TIGR02302 family protein [unclassified Aureimonas]|uniref:TIGR02302 family protein n=1 Tax=unclassified Aureimonas TaxID=2615206 RepID=UPI0006F653E1|nr:MULTISPECIES: TIGR02302 family protein [unclassified Aureimonas]KQT53958.1 hypothetical protein ASG62_12070 [Aureimonas sp. Leaf427]KQT71602.1 hypothetical protein ASG54_19090 [Aureimonas sp. Leaf460]